MTAVSISSATRHRTSRLPYSAVAKEVLTGWDISLAFVGPREARALNKKLRKKNYVPNVLSYVVGEKSGEIIICRSAADKQASSFGLAPSAYCLYLFIHGLLHLSGWAHSDTMEAREQSLLAKFAGGVARSILSNEKTNRDGNRHRHLSSQIGRRRRAH